MNERTPLTQRCWPTTPNIVGCYMLRPFAHPIVVLLRVFETGQTFSYVHANGATTPNIVGPTMLEIIWKKRVIAVIDATFAVAKWKPERNSDLYHNGIRTLDLCDTGEALYQFCQQELTSQLGAGRWIGLLQTRERMMMKLKLRPFVRLFALSFTREWENKVCTCMGDRGWEKGGFVKAVRK